MAIVFMVGMALLVGLLLSNSIQENRRYSQLQEAFYKLLEAQNGCLSLIQLAATAKVDAQIAQKYLEQQVKLFSASLEVDADGDSFYRFPKLKGLPNSPDF